MPRYLIQASYTAEALKAFAKSSQDRTSAVKTMTEKLGGKILSLDFAFGDYDIVIIAEVPDDATAVATALIANLPGHLRAYKTTKLISQEEMNKASKIASSATFSGPKAG